MKENSKTLTAKQICKQYNGKQLLKYNPRNSNMMSITIIGYNELNNEVILGLNEINTNYKVYKPFMMSGDVCTCKNRRYKYCIYIGAEKLSKDVQKIKAIAQYRNLTLGKLVAMKNSITSILTNNVENSLYTEEKEFLLVLKSMLTSELPSMRYNSKLIFNKQ